MREKEVVVTPDEILIIRKPAPAPEAAFLDGKLEADYKESFNQTMQVNIASVKNGEELGLGQ